jgi:hypothetical protein
MRRATDRNLKPMPFSRAAGSDRRDKVTSTARGGEVVDNPDMSLQSTAALGSSLLHITSGDESSLEETLCSPALRHLMRSSFQSRLVISCSLWCALRAARRFYAVAWFRLKITSSGRGAFADTRWAHFN